MARLRQIVLPVVISTWAMAGCLSAGQPDQPFSRDWARQGHKEISLKGRENALHGQSGAAPEKGEKAGLRRIIAVDDTGRALLRLGDETGLSCDVNVRGGAPSVKVQYRLRWGKPRPEKEQPARE